MTDHPTSPVSPPSSVYAGALSPAPGMVAEWRRFGAFLRRPRLDYARVGDGAFRVLGRIFALDAALMLLLVIAATIAVAAGIYIPETALAGIEFTPTIILLVLVGAPVMEELAFRGWLSGKPGALAAVLFIALGVAGFGVAHFASPIFSFGFLIAGILGAIAALFWLRNSPPPRWFAALFPLFFWLSTLAFALIHIANFDEGSLLILLPLVLPQFILGMLCGYVRVRIGLWGAMLLHAAHNAFALSLAALAMLVQGAG